MAISFVCGECHKKLKAPDQAAGKTLPCPHCKTRQRVPDANHPSESEFDPAWLESNESSTKQGEAGSYFKMEEPDEIPTEKPKPLRKEEILRADETPGWLRHLHWMLLLALVPLIISLGFSTNREEAISKLFDSLEQLDPGTRKQIESALIQGNEEAVFRLLPDHKFKGAWLSHDTKAHWGLAFGSALLFLLFLFLLSLQGTAHIGHLVACLIFTATIGIFLLLAVQAIASWTEGRIIIGRGIGTILFYIFKFIGFSYRAALDSNNGFVLSFIGFVFGVGLCEELCKALPVILYVKREDANWHGALLWGLASGTGFGVAEGIIYSIDFYNGIYGASMYAVRFLSCVALHAVFSGGVAILLMLLREKILEAESWGNVVATVFLAILPPMLLHGLFDTFLKRDLNLGALIVAILSFGYMAVLSYFLHGKDDEMAQEEMLRKYKKMRGAGRGN